MNTCLKGYVTLWMEVPDGKSQPSMFGGHWSNASRDIKYLLRHITSQNNVIERLSYSMDP